MAYVFKKTTGTWNIAQVTIPVKQPLLLISLNLKPLKPAIAIQLPKIMGTFLHFPGTSHIYTKILPKPQNPTRQNVNPKTTSWIPPTSRWFAEPQTPSAGSAVRSPLLGWWPFDGGEFFLTKKNNGRHLGFSKANPFSYGWLSIGWWINQIFT